MSILPDLLRAGSVKRWHIVNTSRVQTLAEHQYSVAIIASELGRMSGYSDDMVAMVSQLALLHDVGEARTGDIPTPTKKILRKHFGSKFDAVLSEFDAFDPDELPAEVIKILKCADYLESMHFLNEHRVGRHADAVMDDIMTDAMAYFANAGQTGVLANRIWSELQNAVYSI